MNLIAYYEGAEDVRQWVEQILSSHHITFKRMPVNSSKEYTELPAYVSDILYLDKPDIILAAQTDSVYEKPLFSIEFAGCTPQYQHALQRFSRMMASVAAGCPSLIIMPLQKAENNGGARLYQRSRALEYGAVRLMDAYRIPAFVFDWPDNEGTLLNEEFMSLPKIDTESINALTALLKQALSVASNNDYISALWRLPSVINLVDKMRNRAYSGGAPTIQRPGGGEGGDTQAALKLWETSELIDEIRNSVTNSKDYLNDMPEFLKKREKSLVFNPTRVVQHAGDPYVGMIGYYDIAFCRNGPSTRDRIYNLVAYCKNVSIDEVSTAMGSFISNSCPFSQSLTSSNVLKYSYHLKHGCRETKIKPLRIYSELADIVFFKDGMLFNVG